MVVAMRLIYGVAINDANYTVSPLVNGVQVYCPVYRAWRNMLTRCLCEKFKMRHPEYRDAKVCEEWLRFSVFKEWADPLIFDGAQLDKDFLEKGNKLYSPSKCCFITGSLNRFMNGMERAKGDYQTGVSKVRGKNIFCVKCHNPFTLDGEYIGYFKCPIEAHNAWKKRKHELACQLAGLQTDERVANALRTRYL